MSLEDGLSFALSWAIVLGIITYAAFIVNGWVRLFRWGGRHG